MQRYVERLRAAGHDAEVIEYPSAAHAFDNPLAAHLAAASANFQSVRNCRIREEADGLLINIDTMRLFTYGDACVMRGARLGFDPVAAKAAIQSVDALLKSVFALD